MKTILFCAFVMAFVVRLNGRDSYSYGNRNFSGDVKDTTVCSILCSPSQWDGAKVRFFAFVTLNRGERGVLNIDLHQDVIAAEMKYCTPSISGLSSKTGHSINVSQDDVGALHHKIVEVIGTIHLSREGGMCRIVLGGIEFLRVVGEFTVRPYQVEMYTFIREDGLQRSAGRKME